MRRGKISYRPFYRPRSLLLSTLLLLIAYIALRSLAVTDVQDLPVAPFEVRFYDTQALCALAYDANTRTLYWPISSKEEMRIRALSVNNGAARILFSDGYHIDYHNPQKITISDEKSRFDAWVQFTPLPVVNIRTDSGESPADGYRDAYQHDVLTPCTVSVFDPNWQVDDGIYGIQYTGSVHLRGGSTRKMDKKSYRFNFSTTRDGIDKKRQIPLLGMHSNDGWVLDALSVDHSLVRVPVGERVWNELLLTHEPPYIRNTLTGQYVEILLNGAYQGLYYLRVPIQGATLGLDSPYGVLFTDHGYANIDLDAAYTKTGKQNRLQTMSISYPKGLEDYDAYWPFVAETMKKLMDKMYAGQGDAQELLDIENATDLWLFNQLLYSIDTSEHTKNVYYSKRDWRDDAEKLWLTPWDIDLTMQLSICGHDASAVSDGHVIGGLFCTKSVPPDAVVKMPLLDYLLEPEYSEGTALLKARWKELRTSAWSQNALTKYIEEKEEFLRQSGAAQRDAVLWKNEDIFEQIEQMKCWLRERAVFLDRYIGSL